MTDVYADSEYDSAGEVAGGHPQEITLIDKSGVLSRTTGTIGDVLAVMNDLKLIRTFIANELVDKIDYGIIPGTGTKKNLLLPGAQKIAMFFNVRPEYRVERSELTDGHVEYIVNVQLISRSSGLPVGAGVGSCTTMEGKYRYRNAQADDTGEIVPKAYWKDRDPELLGGKQFTAIKVDGQWHIARKSGEKVENENIWDVRNTVLKMAKKRALVDAAIGLGCLSELFTQDLEDIFDLGSAGADHSSSNRNAETADRATTHPPGDVKSPAAQPEPAASPADPISQNEFAIITIRTVALKDGKPHSWKYQGVRQTFYIDGDGKKWKFVGDEAIDIADKACEIGASIRVEYQQDKFGRTVVGAVML